MPTNFEPKHFFKREIKILEILFLYASKTIGKKMVGKKKMWVTKMMGNKKYQLDLIGKTNNYLTKNVPPKKKNS